MNLKPVEIDPTALKFKRKPSESFYLFSIFHANLPLYFHTLSFKFHLSLSQIPAPAFAFLSP